MDEVGARKVVLTVHGKPVTWLWIHDLVWRVGSSKVRMGGIGGMFTEPAYRNRGYAAQCMRRAVADMHEHGIAMAALFGIGGFYHRWGFASVIPEPRIKVSTRMAKESIKPAGLRVRNFNRHRHAAAVLRLYRENNRELSASLVRPTPDAWKPFPMGSDWGVRTESFVLESHRGKVEGYASYDKSKTSVTVVEVGAADARVFPALTAEVARRAVARRVEAIAFHLPVDHPYVQHLRRWNTEQRVSYYKNADGMGRIIRLYETLTQCAGEFSRRLRRSVLRSTDHTLSLVTDIGTVVLAACRGQVIARRGARARMSAKLPQAVLTQLLLGYRSVAEAATLPDVKISRDALEFMDVLFPVGSPYMYQGDRF